MSILSFYREELSVSSVTSRPWPAHGECCDSWVLVLNIRRCRRFAIDAALFSHRLFNLV